MKWILVTIIIYIWGPGFDIFLVQTINKHCIYGYYEAISADQLNCLAKERYFYSG